MIWCVEDDADIREIEIYTLRSTGFEADGFPDWASTSEALTRSLPELFILDVMLPETDGVTILKRLRADPRTSEIPVIMATARGAEFDKIQSLDLGADDYLVKPFGMMEMVSRVRAVLRRSAPKETPVVYSCGGVTLDDGTHEVTSNGSRVTLTLKEYELLKLLMRRPGQVFTRETLLSEIWGLDYDGETRTVDVHIRTLRQKLGDGGSVIGTIRGVGYRLEAGGI